MRNWFLVVGISGSLGVGCGAEPVGFTGDEGTGESSGALTAVAPSGSQYRLDNATFAILSPSGQRIAVLKPDPTTLTASVTLKPGTYSVVIDPGWVLQRKIDLGWVDVQATVTTVPVGKFNVNSNATTQLPFTFSAGFNTGLVTPTSTPVTAAPPGPGATGTALIKIAVDDCGLYVSKISSLAAFTIECLGKVEKTQFSKSGGKLVRNFTTCSTGNTTALASIDGILSLQEDRPTLVAAFPEAKRDIDINKAFAAACIATEWEKWSASVTANVCPIWQLVATQNPPETGVDAVIAAGLPTVTPAGEPTCGEGEAPPDGTPLAATSPSLVQMQKSGQTYELTFPPGSPTPNCGTPAQCAVACGGGFKNFILSSDGVNHVTADPAYWELGTTYDAASNPFLKAGYYHAMADYGPVPGDQFGHAQRAAATDAAGNTVGEACTYYLSGTRFFTKLIKNTNSTGTVSWCRPPR
jgi:hypothetical protein